MRSRLWNAAVLVMSMLFVSQSWAGLTRHRGIYVTTENIKSAENLPPQEVFEVEGVDGILIRVNWDLVNPGPGVFNWQILDPILDKVMEKRMKLSIGVVSGIYAPKWIGDIHGAPFSEFVVAQRGCLLRRVYHPWNPIYIEAYTRMMKNLKTYLEKKNAYKNLRIVKMSAFAQQTLELRLPRLPSQVVVDEEDGKSCLITDQTKIWQEAGYRPSLILQSYKKILHQLANIFSDKQISQAILHVQGFPYINEQGQLITPEEVTLGDEIVAMATKMLGDRMAFQHTNLNNKGYKLGDRTLSAAERGSSLGWQTNLWGGPNGSQCFFGEDPEMRDCDAITYEQTLNVGINHGASYLEVWTADVLAFPEVIQRTSMKIRNR